MIRYCPIRSVDGVPNGPWREAWTYPIPEYPPWDKDGAYYPKAWVKLDQWHRAQKRRRVRLLTLAKRGDTKGAAELWKTYHCRVVKGGTT